MITKKITFYENSQKCSFLLLLNSSRAFHARHKRAGIIIKHRVYVTIHHPQINENILRINHILSYLSISYPII